MPRKAENQNKEEKTENELAVKKNETAPAVANDNEVFDITQLGFSIEELEELTGLDDLDPNDFQIPYAKLYSKDTAERAKGDIEFPNKTVIHGADGEVMENVTVLKWRSVRVMFPEPFKKSNTFICRSLDGKVGAPDGKYAGTPCATCEFAQYPEGGGASACRDQRLLLCTLDDGTLFHMLVSGISVKPFRKSFLSSEVQRGLREVKNKYRAKMMAGVNVTMGVEMETTDNGVFPRLELRVPAGNEVHSPERLKANLEQFSDYKDFEGEAVASAATFAQYEQGEHDTEGDGDTGQNAEMF
jgi:hypothetical protein